MTLTVLEATKLSSFENFKLIAGHRGLDREILKVESWTGSSKPSSRATQWRQTSSGASLS